MAAGGGGLPPCPKNWEPKNLPNYDAIMTRRSTLVASVIRSSAPGILAQVVKDTRPVHGSLFNGFTPPHFPYFAGNYRGSRHSCLASYEVTAGTPNPNSPKVGHPAATVPIEMDALAGQIDLAIQEMDLVWNAPNAVMGREAKLVRLVELVAAIFVYWMEIHPYANGNGHTARFLMLALFARQQIFLNSKMTVHPRPSDPNYISAIADHRMGKTQPLHLLILQCL